MERWRGWHSPTLRANVTLRLPVAENEILRSESVERAFRLTDRALFVPCMPAPRRGEEEEDEEEEEEAELPEGGGSPSAAAARAPRLGVARATADQLRQAKEHAYMDSPVKIGNVHISAPHMYALILEKLALKPGESMHVKLAHGGAGTVASFS